jgi:hypothetical protein
MTEHPLSDGPLPFRKIMDAGFTSYHEFACSKSTLSWMQATGIPVNATLQVMEQCVGGHNVIVKVWPIKEIE